MNCDFIVEFIVMLGVDDEFLFVVVINCWVLVVN